MVQWVAILDETDTFNFTVARRLRFCKRRRNWQTWVLPKSNLLCDDLGVTWLPKHHNSNSRGEAIWRNCISFIMSTNFIKSLSKNSNACLHSPPYNNSREGTFLTTIHVPIPDSSLSPKDKIRVVEHFKSRPNSSHFLYHRHRPINHERKSKKIYTFTTFQIEIRLQDIS